MEERSLALAALRRWWWVPLVLLVLIVVKAWVVGGMAQGRAQELAADAAGLPPDRVEMVDGLNVRLTGFTDAETRDEAVAAVEALDSSWDVDGLLVDTAESDAAAQPGDASPETTEAPTTAAETGAAAVLPDAEPAAAFSAEGVTLRGTVGSDSTRRALVAAAVGRFGAAAVDDQLAVDAAAVTDDGGSLVVTGAAPTDAVRDEWLSGAGEIADAGGMTVVDELEVGGVAQELNSLFELQPIEFDTARATIRSASEPTLDEAVELIAANPDVGVLRVVGHTDTDGAAEANLALSLARAEAVVAYLVGAGIDPSRLIAEGRGETELKANPEITPEDKQRNRRIEWEVDG